MQAKASIYSVLGLTRDPFPPTPDAGSYFFTSRLQDQFAEIRHCIEARKGFVLVTGEVGLGKSTLVRRLLDSLPAGEVNSALIFNTFLQETALLAAVLSDFGVPVTGKLDSDLAALNAFFIAEHRAGKTCLLIIDDAQNLTSASLELVRLLCNLETDQEKLLQILLVGQPELATTISAHALRQLKSRIVQHAELHGLLPQEALRYVEFRITAAGGEGRLSLTASAAKQLYKLTTGNTRLMHLILDRCLYGLVGQAKNTIDIKLLSAAASEVMPRSKPRFGLWRIRYALLTVLACLGSLAGVVLVQASQNTQSSLAGRVNLFTQAPTSSPPAKVTLTASESISGHKRNALPPPAFSGGQTTNALAAACLPVMQAGYENRPLVTQRLPEMTAKRLRSNPSTCVETHHSQTWATWLADPSIEQARVLGKGDALLQTQKNLARLGWLPAGQIDGFSGPQTRQALQAFQRSLALSPNGEIGDLTYMLLENLNAL